MTRFAAPFKIKRPFEETTVASIDVSGSAKFNQGASFGGNVVIAGTIDVSGAIALDGGVSVAATANFLAPVFIGSTAGAMGRPVLVQQVEISGNNTKKPMTLPAGSDILDIKYVSRAAFSTALSQVDILVGTSADDVKLARFTNVSGMFYQTKTADTDVSGMTSVSGASSIIVVQATAISGAIASGGRGVATVVYVQKQ